MTEKVTIGNCELWHGDCREVLPLLPPVDLVLTDPPYGIAHVWKGGGSNGWGKAKADTNERNEWDEKAPTREFFEEYVTADLQIIWGGNYFDLPMSRGWLVWNKPERNFTLAEAELAWTNFDMPVRVWDGPRSDTGREHPTQKPLRLMEWCISKANGKVWGKKGVETVCDPFMGSGTTGVACARMGLQFVGIERERKYFDIACKRIEQAYAQPRLFEDKVGAGDAAVQGDMLLPANADVTGLAPKGD